MFQDRMVTDHTACIEITGWRERLTNTLPTPSNIPGQRLESATIRRLG